jgi:molybdopterin-guanine dinucleotide biosynthesis protein A
MGCDKAVLDYHGRTQLECAFDLLKEHCDAVFVSVRPDQRAEPTRAKLPQIVDALPGIGPIAGISAALTAHPDRAWLVLACDLPFLSDGVLKHLLARRDPMRIATAYRSAHDGFPEPLCAIWEPAANASIAAALESGKHCPRKVLINSNAMLLEQVDPRSLDNINTPEEFAATRRTLAQAS